MRLQYKVGLQERNKIH